MSLLMDAIRARSADALRNASPDRVQTELVAFWDSEEAANVPDLDYLNQAGMLIADADVPNAERWLNDWLTRKTSANAWDTAGAFLMGYWQNTESADPQLTDRLVSCVSETTLPVSARDTVLCALGRAHRWVGDDAMRNRIRKVFLPIWEREHKGQMQPLVRIVMKNVLGIED